MAAAPHHNAGKIKNLGQSKPRADRSEPVLPLLNRELSWLQFNRRVLHEAVDERTPLLERVRFLGIFTSNLDEFFMKRVGGLKRQIAAGVVRPSQDGMAPAAQLAAIRESVLPMLAEQARVYTDVIHPMLAEQGVRLLTWQQLSAEQRAVASRYFRDSVFPVLTPLAVDPGHPFPYISNLSTSLGLILRHPQRGEQLFARVKVPEVLPAWILLESDRPTGADEPRIFEFVSLIDLIRHHLNELFIDMEVVAEMLFRLTRNADVARDEDDAEDLLEMVEQELRQRRFESVIRLEHPPQPSNEILAFLMAQLDLEADNLYEMPGELDYTNLYPISDLNLAPLRYTPWKPVVPVQLADEGTDIFSLIRRGDMLVHHPYESFEASVERFIREAAGDPKVLAIKMTVYRTGEQSPFIETLIEAAEAGKQVLCLVELKARFDEARNINWAQSLEKAGVHVVYGIVGLKTHTKTALVVREDSDGIRCYAHISTGNYHTGTARLYTDFGLFTCKRQYTDDLVELFHYLSGRSMQRDYRKLLVAPVNMRRRFIDMIDREIDHHRSGRQARIIAKINSLESKSITEALYRASSAGVQIDLIVRGFCCLRPGIEGVSENIHVISIIGRFLEHSRIFFFQNGEPDPVDGEYYIGSADWMYRNLLGRVEAITPIEDKPLRHRCWQALTVMLDDQRQAWDMQSDGSYVQRRPSQGNDHPGTHELLMNAALHQVSAGPGKDV